MYCLSQTARRKVYQKEMINVEDMIFKWISYYILYNVCMYANVTSSPNKSVQFLVIQFKRKYHLILQSSCEVGDHGKSYVQAANLPPFCDSSNVFSAPSHLVYAHLFVCVGGLCAVLSTHVHKSVETEVATGHLPQSLSTPTCFGGRVSH